MSTLATITSRVESDVAAALGGTVPIPSGIPEAILSRLVADASASAEAHAQYILREIDPRTCSLDGVAAWGEILGVPRFPGQVSRGTLTASISADAANAWRDSSVGDTLLHKDTGRRYTIAKRVDGIISNEWEVRYDGPVGTEGDLAALGDSWVWEEGDLEFVDGGADIREGYVAWTGAQWRERVADALQTIASPGSRPWYRLQVSLMPGVYRAWFWGSSPGITVAWIWDSPADGPTEPDARHEAELNSLLAELLAEGHTVTLTPGAPETLDVTIELTPDDPTLYDAVERAIGDAITFSDDVDVQDIEAAVLRVPGVTGARVTSGTSLAEFYSYAVLGTVTFA